MEQKPIVLPLDLSPDEARMPWKGALYTLSCALYLPGRAEVELDVVQQLETARLVVKLVPFREALRSKMFAALADPGTSAPSTPGATAQGTKPAWGAVVGLDIRQGLVTSVEDVRRAIPRALAPGLRPGEEFDPTAAEVVELPAEEKDSLRAALQKHVDSVLLPYVREPFASFLPEAQGDAWKSRQLPSRKPDVLVPFQLVFPDSFPFELRWEDEEYFLDDLYCTRPGCPCTDVTCVVLKHDTASGQNVAQASFKYQTDSGKVKAMPDFPGKFNASEWMKRFSKAHPIDLELVLKSRYTFMRTRFIDAYWKKNPAPLSP